MLKDNGVWAKFIIKSRGMERLVNKLTRVAKAWIPGWFYPMSGAATGMRQSVCAGAAVV